MNFLEMILQVCEGREVFCVVADNAQVVVERGLDVKQE